MANIEYGLMVMIVGMTVVMVTLYGLSLVMKLFKAMFYKPTQPVVQAAVTQAPEEMEIEEVDEMPIIVAISAAISAYLGQPLKSFNVISITPQPSSLWASIGRQERLNSNITNRM